MLRALAPYLAYSYLTFVKWTTRVVWRDAHYRDDLRDADKRFCYAFWHNRQVFMTVTHRDANTSVMVSRSADGEIIARVMELSRIDAARGSSSRGASAALKTMVDAVERGLDVGITPDGPKGPVFEVKAGALFLSQKLGIPIVPITNALSRKLVLKRSWDQFQVPLPFGRAVVRYGRPIYIKNGDDLREKALEIKRELDRITAEADAEAAG